MSDLTIVIPVKNPKKLDEWLEQMKWIFKEHKAIIIDSGGGERLKVYAWKYIKKNLSEWEARELGYSFVETPFILNLDVDTVLPKEYVEEALELLRSGYADVTAIDYEKSIGHYGFGTSVWRTEVLRRVYDYPPKALELALAREPSHFHVFRYTICECIYIWNKAIYQEHVKFIPLLYKAVNLEKV